jgi:hypothetical protein
VAGAVESKAVLLDGDDVAAGMTEPLVELVALAEVVRSRQAGEPCTEDLNGGVHR